MAWDEWEELKGKHTSTGMQLNGIPADETTTTTTGDLEVGHGDLTKLGKSAHELYNQLWDRARVNVASSDSAAGSLTKQGFELGSGLKHVSSRWDEQLKSLMDACAQITNHMQTTKRVHDDDDNYIRRQMSSIDALDAGFDERVGEPGGKNPAYYGKPDKGEKKDE
ncbi:hypothetical protein [Streptomyces sp. cg35]|uniref:hypothetical protein n=1 Tax=Streptomyces sp. cg35 TaxID=3421650 RepID=UPI003D184876